LEFGGGTHTLQASSSIDASNATVILNSPITIAGSYNAGTTTIANSASFNSDNVTFSTLNIESSGNRGGSASVSLSSTGTTNIPAGATLNLNTGLNNHLFLARPLNNSGTTILTQAGQSGTVFFLQRGTFNNQAGGVFDVRAARGINSNGGTNLFSNAGT